MSERKIQVSRHDLQSINWQQVADAHGGSRSYERANAFYAAAYEAKERGEPRAEAAFRLLGDVCSFRLASDKPQEPFRPFTISETFKSADPGEISRDEVEALREIAPMVQDPWFRARLADFVWSARRGFPMALLAVDAYLSHAGNPELEGGLSSERLASLERAVQLAVHLGPSSTPRQRVKAFIEDALSEAVTANQPVAHRLLVLSAQHRFGDPLELYRTASVIAESAEATGDWFRAERYWLVAEDLAIVAQHDGKRRDALRRVAETYVGRAQAVSDQPHIGKATAAAHLQHAVEALRRAGGMQERVDEIHRQMLEYQQDISASFVPLSHSIPIGDAVALAQGEVSGKSLEEALLRFALHPYIPKFSDLSQQAKDNAARYILRELFPAVQLNAAGKIVARQGSLNVSDPQDRAAALRVDMVQSASRYHEVFAAASVVPARDQIAAEHPIRVEDFFWIVSNNPLVPPGRERLYAEAFYAGFTGDLPKAIHILVHQLENSIRWLLHQHGVVVSGLSKEGIQMERNLNTLLYSEELQELLGEDIVFALQSLLVEKFGPDLRNRVAHGLMNYGEFTGRACEYFWWLSFRTICVPLLNALSEANPDG
jgi:hypothetical protein